jgi:Asp-tRNA(Asn)/Glu-tRNA(Gln) amidotransferase C subunit
MVDTFWLDKEAFLKIAEVSGLDMTDRHMEELYAFVQQLLSNLKDIEDLDLRGMEPFMPSLSTKGDSKLPLPISVF